VRMERRASFQFRLQRVRRRALDRVGMAVYQLPIAILPTVDLRRPEECWLRRAAGDRYRRAFIGDRVSQTLLDIKRHDR
jgi:hypothetical protein